MTLFATFVEGTIAAVTFILTLNEHIEEHESPRAGHAFAATSVLGLVLMSSFGPSDAVHFHDIPAFSA